MRFDGVIRQGVMPLVLALAIGMGGAHAAEAVKPMPTRQQVETVLTEVKADPDLPGTKMEKTLRFKDRTGAKDKEKEKKKDEAESDWRALTDFMQWVAEAGRMLIWLLAALIVIWVALRVRRWARFHAAFAKAGAGPLPSHVSSLDIRPESLPPDIGTEAVMLWQRGEHRLALSLLYRAALSRLVHVDAVLIASADTEGECVALVSATLAPERAAFFARLVAAWQLAVYGGRLPADAEVQMLCAEFSRHLPEQVPPAMAASPAGTMGDAMGVAA